MILKQLPLKSALKIIKFITIQQSLMVGDVMDPSSYEREIINICLFVHCCSSNVSYVFVPLSIAPPTLFSLVFFLFSIAGCLLVLLSLLLLLFLCLLFYFIFCSAHVFFLSLLSTSTHSTYLCYSNLSSPCSLFPLVNFNLMKINAYTCSDKPSAQHPIALGACLRTGREALLWADLVMQLLQCSNKKLSVTFSNDSKKEISKTVSKTGEMCPDKWV